MTLKGYTKLWILITLVLAYEAFALNYHPLYSIWATIKENSLSFKTLNLSPEAGRTISTWYGWAGLGIMLLTNFYILRKRWSPLKNLGRLAGWLDFHIFCGLLGPTFIVFHTNFKVGGLVAVSFWSMMVSFSSGIVGRYFYIQMLRQKSDLEKDLLSYQSHLNRIWPTAPEDLTRQVLLKASSLAGAGDAGSGALKALSGSLIGDVRLFFGIGKIYPGLPALAQQTVKRYAKTKRRVSYLNQFQSLMGYWHSFHMPFAVFMYIVAAIHVAVVTLLAVH